MGTLITRGGVIYVDFRFKGQRCREVTQMLDTQQNRRKCDAFLKRIEAEIVLGTFDYAAYFPDGGKVELFRTLEKRIASAKSHTPLFRAFAETWFAERRIEWRRSYVDTMRITLNKYLEPHFGDSALDLIEKSD
jgi:integrase